MGLVFGDDNGSAAEEAVKKNLALLYSTALPDYEEWVPELYNTESSNYELVGEDPLIRSAQMQALSRMAGLAETGLSDADAADFNEARQAGNQLAKGSTDAAIQNANARGVGGSGLEFAMREAGGQAGAQRAQAGGLDVAANAAKNRALYQTAYGDALGEQRSGDNRINSQNTGIINQFNQQNTQNRNAVNQSNTDVRNDAFKYNEGLKDKRYQNEMQRVTGTSNLNNQAADVQLAQAEAERRKRQAVTGAVGAGVGAYFGGPAGAQAGHSVGSAL